MDPTLLDRSYMHSFLDQLRRDAFDECYPAFSAPDLQGWVRKDFSTRVEAFLDKRDRNLPLVIVEVGTWKGLSASIMANVVKSLGFVDVTIVCIDTWLGAPEFWTQKGLADTDRGMSLCRTGGYPTVFYRFASNMKRLGHDDIIAPFPISSIQGAKVLEHYGIQADLIYIDAAHEYEAVSADMKAFWPLVKPGGIMLGDDYDGTSWPGVVRAVKEFPVTADIHGDVWVCAKGLDG